MCFPVLCLPLCQAWHSARVKSEGSDCGVASKTTIPLLTWIKHYPLFYGRNSLKAMAWKEVWEKGSKLFWAFCPDEMLLSWPDWSLPGGPCLHPYDVMAHLMLDDLNHVLWSLQSIHLKSVTLLQEILDQRGRHYALLSNTKWARWSSSSQESFIFTIRSTEEIWVCVVAQHVAMVFF